MGVSCLGGVLQVRTEVERRKNGGRDMQERRMLIQQSYRQLHQSVYTLQVSVYSCLEFLKLLYMHAQDNKVQG